MITDADRGDPRIEQGPDYPGNRLIPTDRECHNRLESDLSFCTMISSVIPAFCSNLTP